MSLAEVPRTAARDAVPSGQELIDRARALAPKLRERAVRAEQERHIPRESVEEFIDASLIHTLQPKRWGGYEHDHEVAFNIAIELGRSTCGSSAWCLNYLADHACMLALPSTERQSGGCAIRVMEPSDEVDRFEPAARRSAGVTTCG